MKLEGEWRWDTIGVVIVQHSEKAGAVRMCTMRQRKVIKNRRENAG